MTTTDSARRAWHTRAGMTQREQAALGLEPTHLGKRSRRLVLAILALLYEYPDGLETATVNDMIADRLPLTPREAAPLPSGKSRLGAGLSWASFGMRRAGWLEKGHGVWRLTAAGRAQVDKLGDALNADYWSAVRRGDA